LSVEIEKEENESFLYYFMEAETSSLRRKMEKCCHLIFKFLKRKHSIGYEKSTFGFGLVPVFQFQTFIFF
jgi:hypothetical protein